MSLAYDLMIPSMFTWGDLAARAVSADFDPERDHASEMDPPDSILGAPLSKLLWTRAPRWPVEPIPTELRRVHESMVETLLISSSLDFSTPPELARDELLPTLPRGRQIVLAEMGHTQDLWDAQPEALHHLLTTFFDSGLVDDSGFHDLPMDFEVSWGLPRLAKAALAMMIVIVLGVAGATWLLWRRLKHRAVR
jgi:hypothetical protein